jgi:uncharacterized protein YgbK (DUF1537 family)
VAEVNELLLTFYGDDLTGSTDSLEALVLGGVPTVLFLEQPAAEQLSRFPGVRAVGLAGVSRTMTPAEMGEALPDAFSGLKSLGAPLTHYKVCSTFDSSPEIGSIGRAAEIGRRVFGSPIIPVLVGAPKLKRYVVFGNHFATADGVTYRLDRHPTMSVHPITPMDEADLQLHLGRQTDLSIGLIDLHHLAESDEHIWFRLLGIADAGIQVAILDTLDEGHLLKAGQLLWSLGQQAPAFVIGSSGVEFALASYWGSTRLAQPPGSLPAPGPVKQIVAVSGSASPRTAAQIRHTLDHGFAGVRLDSMALVDPGQADAARVYAVQQALAAIADGRSVILYSVLGPDDSVVRRTLERMAALDIPSRRVGWVLGEQLGLILKEILLKTGMRRCAVAGGDTSGRVLSMMRAYVLEFLVPLGTATPLCRAGSHDPAFDGLEISLKGGQLGEIDYFERVVHGREV